MQRLNNTDVFLRPDGTGSRICQVRNGLIANGAHVRISPACPISISSDGIIAALTGEDGRPPNGGGLHHLWLARVDENLNARVLLVRSLPNGLVGRSVAVEGQRVFVGGSYHREAWLGELDLRAAAKKAPAIIFKDLPKPPQKESDGKAVNDLLLLGRRLFAIDDIMLPNILLTYDLVGSDGRSVLAHCQEIPPHQSGEHILHGAIGGKWLALLSGSMGREGSFRHLSLYHANTGRKVVSFHFEVEDGQSLSVQTTGYMVDSPMHRVRSMRSADQLFPVGFLPVQVVAVGSLFYLLGARGEVLRLDLGGLTPTQAAAGEGSERWISWEPTTGLTDGIVSLLVALPVCGRVVASNVQGDVMVIGGTEAP